MKMENFSVVSFRGHLWGERRILVHGGDRVPSDSQKCSPSESHSKPSALDPRGDAREGGGLGGVHGGSPAAVGGEIHVYTNTYTYIYIYT